MKTNIVLQSKDRELFGVAIRQQTKTGFLNLSDLQDVYDKERFNKGWHKKRVDHILNYDKSKSNTERVYYILKKQGIINVPFSTFIEMVKNSSLTRVLKKLKAYKTTGARQTKTTWVNPYIWILIALEMHPELYANTVIWLTDKLIINRIEAGDFYKELTSAVTHFKNVNYVRLAKGLNYIIFGRHETGIRNTATGQQLKELHRLESQLAFAINMGYIKDFNALIKELSKLYHQKIKEVKAIN